MQDSTATRQRYSDRCARSPTDSAFEPRSRVPAPDVTGANVTGHASTLLDMLWLGTSGQDERA